MIKTVLPLASTAGGTGSIPSQGTKIPHATEQLRLPATMKDLHAAMEMEAHRCCN